MPRPADVTPVPASLITGFLGSGKTTLLNALLSHPGMKETAVIVNEFGEIGLDHLLIESAFEDAVLLKSGCICCTVRGDLVDTIETLDARMRRGEIPRFKRIAIETTGLADPAPILATLMEDARLKSLVALDRVVATVDAANALSQLDAHYESAKQAALADYLVLTKTDLVSRETRAAVEARLKAFNPWAPVLIAVDGRIAPEALFGAAPESASRDVRLAAAERLGHHDHGHDGGAAHLAHAHGIATFTLTHDAPVAWDDLRAWLESLASLKGPDLLRMKGLINVRGRAGPVALNGVQHVFHPPRELKAWPDADRRTRIVFITRNIPRDAVARSFAAALRAGVTKST
ncbi:MAG TPA: GTP-binding protein [Stellaceae bacterium]|nr:GTP-binding protein [Stellaceae bacterium]